jgi:hypothetical protein
LVVRAGIDGPAVREGARLPGRGCCFLGEPYFEVTAPITKVPDDTIFSFA